MSFSGITNPNKFRECLRILKKVVGSPTFGQINPVDNEHRTDSLSVTLPTHTPTENGTSPIANGEPVERETFQRHNVQKLKVDNDRLDFVYTGPHCRKRPSMDGALSWSYNN